MKDIQKTPDHREIDIQKVGIKGFHLPLSIVEKKGGEQPVLGEISLSADLTRDFKGSHLSRFVEILTPWSKKKLSSVELKKILEDTMSGLNSKSAYIDVRFRYFVPKLSPVSRMESLLDYNCLFLASLDEKSYEFTLGVEVPVMNLCPCSKEISQFGAHNQRGYIRVKIKYDADIIWIEDLVGIIEAQGSSPVYPLLKRQDEKFVTEASYENPKFVEDVLRDTILALRNIAGIKWMEVECEDFESIHHHSAFAFQREHL